MIIIQTLQHVYKAKQLLLNPTVRPTLRIKTSEEIKTGTTTIQNKFTIIQETIGNNTEVNFHLFTNNPGPRECIQISENNINDDQISQFLNINGYTCPNNFLILKENTKLNNYILEHKSLIIDIINQNLDYSNLTEIVLNINKLT